MFKNRCTSVINKTTIRDLKMPYHNHVHRIGFKFTSYGAEMLSKTRQSKRDAAVCNNAGYFL